MAFVVFLSYSLLRIRDFSNKPNDVVVTPRWTIVNGPVLPGPLYPMNIECLAAEGCIVALRYAGNTAFSSACVTASAQVVSPGSILLVGGQVNLAQGEEVQALVCYTDDPRDGIFSWHNGSSPFGIPVESVAPIFGDVTRVKIPLHAGRTLFKLVNTTDHTYPSGNIGHARAEWYPTLLGTGLIDTYPAHDHAAQGFIDSQWTEVSIHEPNVLALAGELGGAWTLSLGVVAIIYFATHHAKDGALETCLTLG